MRQQDMIIERRKKTSSNTLVIEDELLPSSDRVLAEQTFDIKGVILDVVDRFDFGLDVEDDQSTIGEIAILGEKTSAGNDPVRIAHDVFDVRWAHDSFLVGSGRGVIGELNDVRHGSSFLRDRQGGTHPG